MTMMPLFPAKPASQTATGTWRQVCLVASVDTHTIINPRYGCVGELRDFSSYRRSTHGGENAESYFMLESVQRKVNMEYEAQSTTHELAAGYLPLHHVSYFVKVRSWKNMSSGLQSTNYQIQL
ncbi:hypothetical protein MGYG_02139 [Nannizzia gypsea CBS 118893]|uniref:Uncharacterized protein n=1 Tax=Arthroderma gypseum (strain ATCC MYA-4604 / CBS 118893) TaxID=535722 RepID=E4UPZ3_ARTGP|nr:hypothetical protein MGYG_02139 [Nannizzia gypsea CBS 118893]EFQ99127.1 hypothetical protein MGYG_02139 [Nannizzia gypsea CBS 118893]